MGKGPGACALVCSSKIPPPDCELGISGEVVFMVCRGGGSRSWFR